MSGKRKLLFGLPALRAAIIVGVLGLVILFTGCQNTTISTTNTAVGTGVIEGKVWIGPLPGGPPEKLGLPYPPEIYQPRKIMVYDADHIKLVKQVDITEKGYYRVELPTGKYTVDINYVSTDWSNSVPRKLTIQPGIHINFDIEFNIGISVIPSPGSYLLNSENKSSEVQLKSVNINRNYSDKQYVSPWYPLHTINQGEFIYEVNGMIKNNHPTNKEITMYAEGYDAAGKQVAWTLDAAYIAGQIGLHIDNGGTGEFTLHLNLAENLKSISIFANNYDQVPL